MTVQLIYTPDDLTDAENYALNYAIALVGGPGSRGWKIFEKGNEILDRRGVPGAERRETMRKGLNGLLAKGIITGEKNGEGDYEPRTVHFEKLSPALRLH